ncbi:MAG TPA: DUF4149 domain-containing protein [Candidatus Limnocylindrales bacterium]|nr:DUF4149 domain-containing protein [Candidatus Limnocylindrales bacterium]
MTAVLRFLQFLGLGTWIGGIIFLSFVEAPGVFGILPNRDQAGSVVGYSLTRLHYIGVIAALLYLIAGLALAKSARFLIAPAAILVVLMLALTLASEFGVRPRMAALRSEMGSIDATPPENPLRREFDRLHRASVQLEASTLLLGVVALFLTARKPL